MPIVPNQSKGKNFRAQERMWLWALYHLLQDCLWTYVERINFPVDVLVLTGQTKYFKHLKAGPKRLNENFVLLLIAVRLKNFVSLQNRVANNGRVIRTIRVLLFIFIITETSWPGITIYYNLCNPFKYDLRCASLCGVEFVVTKERREKRAQRESCLKGVRSL